MSCLNDVPDLNMINDEPSMPGIFYNHDDQCRFSYGQNVTGCTSHYVIIKLINIFHTFYFLFLKIFKSLSINFKDECSLLWCQEKDEQMCKSKNDKVADGTLCKDKKNFVN